MICHITALDADGDLERVLEIAAASFTRPWTRAMFSDAIERAHGTLAFVARSADGPLIGYCVGQVVVDELHIHSVTVERRWRGAGVGRRLLGRILDEASRSGVTAATLEVRDSNTAARRLYEQAGFVCVAVRPAYYADPTEPALLYWRHGLRSGSGRASAAS